MSRAKRGADTNFLSWSPSSNTKTGVSQRAELTLDEGVRCEMCNHVLVTQLKAVPKVHLKSKEDTIFQNIVHFILQPFVQTGWRQSIKHPKYDLNILRRFLIPRPPCPPDSGHPGSPVARSISHVPIAARPVDSLLQQPSAPTTAILNKLPEISNDGEQKQGRKRELTHSPLAALQSQLQEVTEQVRQISGDISALLRDSKETTSERLSELRSEGAEAYRWCVVSVSGLGGYLAGLRRSVGPRLIYSLTTATAAAVICYPQEAKHYNAQGLAVIHHCIVYGLKFIRDRPPKPLGIGDSKDSSAKEKSHAEHQGSQKETKTVLNADTLLKKHFGTSDHSYAIFTPKSITIDSREEEGNLLENKTHFNSSERSNRELQDNNNRPSSTYRQAGKLSSQCENDVNANLSLNSLPYSPALPVTPKLGGNHTLQSSEESQEVKTNTLDDINAKFSTHNNNLNGSDRVQDEETENCSFGESNIDTSQNSDSELISNLGPLLVIEDDQDSFKYEMSEKNQHHPLNKKLSRFYVKTSEDTLASIEKEYDDLYSNRK